MKATALRASVPYRVTTAYELPDVLSAELDRGSGAVRISGMIKDTTLNIAEAPSPRGEWLNFLEPKLPGHEILGHLGLGHLKWEMAWSELIRRSGYAISRLDALQLRTLLDLRTRRGARIEVATDTSAVITGGVQYLCRLLGDRIDFFRVDAVHREIAEFAKDKHHYLVGNRTLEVLPHPHPKWRNLDVDDASLFLAESTRGGKKAGDTDLLILRAVARWVREAIPGIYRFFATADGPQARRALHELPGASLLQFHKEEFALDGVLSPILWVPGPDQGLATVSNLGWFIWEALSICESVIVERDPSRLEFRAFIAGRSTMSSAWEAGIVWWRGETSAPSALAEVQATTEQSSDAPDTATSALVEAAQAAAPASSETLAEETISPTPTLGDQVKGRARGRAADSGGGVASVADRRGSRSHRPFMKLVCDWLVALERTSRMQGEFEPDSEVGEATRKQHLAIFEAADLLTQQEDGSVGLGTAAGAAADAVRTSDLDALSALFEKHTAYGLLRQRLRESGALSEAAQAEAVGSAVRYWSVMARQLGQAVEVEGELVDGGRRWTAADLGPWLHGTVDRLADIDPLSQAAISEVARRALMELNVSPRRFADMLRRLQDQGDLGAFRIVRGGTPDRVLPERIVVFDDEGWHLEDCSADGLLGWRALSLRGDD